MMDPPKDPNEQPESSSGAPPAAEDGSRREVDLWCAISESPSLNAPTTDMDANLWPGEAAAAAAAAGGAEEQFVEAPAVGNTGGVEVPWCTEVEHGHGPSSSAGVPRFLADSPNLCSMRDLECGAPGYRFGMLPTQALGRQESLELLAESWSWAQSAQDELVERYSQEELQHFQLDLEHFLILDSDPVAALQQAGLHPMHPPGAVDTPDTLTNDEFAEPSSSVSIGDTPDEGAVVTSSCESQGASAAPSPGILKRKGPVLDSGGTAGASPQTPTTLEQQHQQSMDTLQKKLKGPAAERPSLPRTTRPRYAIQTRTEVDVIDDGYRWRKYGQKPVKNSAHPRNYYRCTTANCPVRKRVERSTENPSHVLTTYDGTHNHPETATGGSHARELNIASSGAADQDVPVPAPVSPQPPAAPPMPPRLPPSNYIEPNIISHLLAAGNQMSPDPSRRWSHPPPAAAGPAFQSIIDLLRAHQLFRMQYGTQYPLLSNMLNLMRRFPRARPPMMDPRLEVPRLDPSLASLFAPQSYNAMRLGGQVHQDPSATDQAQQQQASRTSPSTTSGTTSSGSAGPSVGQIRMMQRLLWQQELMRQGFGSDAGHSSQQQPAASDDSGGAAEKDGPGNHPDVGEPPA